jgi:hypothetical protein
VGTSPNSPTFHRFQSTCVTGDPGRVSRSRVELALWERDRSPRPMRLPFDREVRAVSVSPNDRVVAAAAEDAG